MVIHTKENTKNHVRGEPEAKTKDGNFYTADRSPRVKSTEVSYTKAVNRGTTDKKAVSRNKNITTRKEDQQPGYDPLTAKYSNGNHAGSHSRSNISYHYSGKKPGIQDTCQKGRNIVREPTFSIKIKGSTVKAAGMVGACIVSNQIDGGKEIKDSLLAADTIASPIMTSAGKGADLLRKEMTKKKEILRKETILKKGESLKGKYDLKKKGILRGNETPTKQKTVKKRGGLKQDGGIDQNSVSTKGKATTKNSRYIRSSKTKKNSSRNLMIASFLSRLGQEENQVGLGKALKDAVFMKAGNLVKQMIAHAASFLLFFFSLIAITCLPIVLVVSILYNSPFSLFLPPLQEGETVVSAASAYEADFYAEIAQHGL